MNKKRTLLAVSAAVAASMLLASCGGEEKVSKIADMNLDSYPIKTDAELTYWVALDTNVTATCSNLGETPFAKEMEKRTGVKVKYIHPAIGQEAEAFSLMVASDELADIVEYNWVTALGGPSSSIKDKVIIPLTDKMEQYAPNLTAHLKADSALDAMVKTDEGDYYVFPFVRNYLEYPDTVVGLGGSCTNGPVIRRDWLDDLGLEEPTTPQELEVVLREFKDKKGATAPLTALKYETYKLMALFSATNDFYLDGDTIKYGVFDEEYKTGLSELARWFKEGLLDKNYISADQTMVDSNMLNGNSGVTYASGGSGIGKWLDTMKDKDPKFNVTALQYMAKEKGGKPRFVLAASAYSGYGSAAITTQCEYPELAMKYLDYGYSKEGQMLYNFGVEGETYEMVDGKPKFTDYVHNNPDGLSQTQAMSRYLRAYVWGPFLHDNLNSIEYYQKEQQKDAAKKWTFGLEEASKRKVPAALIMSAEENEEYAQIMTEVEKYRDEMTASIISGIQPVDKYDEMVQRIKELKIDRAIEIKQAAYNRYLNR